MSKKEDGSFIVYRVSDFYNIELENKEVAEKLCKFLSKRDKTQYEVIEWYMHIGVPVYKDNWVLEQLKKIEERDRDLYFTIGTEDGYFDNVDIKEYKKAKECMDFVVASSTTHGFLAEQVENREMKSAWVIGLGWSHAMFIIVLDKLIEKNVI